MGVGPSATYSGKVCGTGLEKIGSSDLVPPSNVCSCSTVMVGGGVVVVVGEFCTIAIVVVVLGIFDTHCPLSSTSNIGIE